MTATTCQAKGRTLSTWRLRGVLGLVFLAVAVSTREGFVASPALVAAIIAFRGCPMCWVFGLIERQSASGASCAREDAS